MKLTKIVATIGPSSEREVMIENLTLTRVEIFDIANACFKELILSFMAFDGEKLVALQQ
jgi:Pyruvate kinase, barrel domain.